MKTYRVAMLGCRSRGTSAARAYHAHPRIEVVGLCDLVQERLDTLGDELGVSARFTDLDEMIRQTDPDLVAIPTGTEFHYPLAMRVLEHGVHIEVEKPLCTDLAEADAVLAKAQEKGVRVAVHHQRRVGGAMRAMARAYDEGRIGQLRYLYACSKGYYGGYGLMNIGVHQLNDLITFAGHCRSLTATALTDGHLITPEDVVPSPNGMGTIAGERITTTLQFDHNVTGSLLMHRFPTGNSAGFAMELYGTEGRLVWGGPGVWWLPTPHFLPDEDHGNWQALAAEVPDHYDPHSSAVLDEYWFAEEWVQALDEGRDHEASGVEGQHVMEIMMGVFESAAYGKRVDLPQAQRDHPLVRWRQEHGLGDPAPMPRPYGEWLAAEDQRLGRRPQGGA